MRAFKSFLTVIGAVTVLVLAANTVAYAATGGKFILGKVNKAGNVSTLKRTTSGSALSLVTKSSANAPLTTNGKGKVANLNADMVDGLDSTSLRTSTYSWTKSVSVATPNKDIVVPLPAGTWVVGYDAYMVSGGLTGSVGGCYFWRQRGGDTTYYGEARYATLTGTSVGATGTSILTVQSGDAVHLYCYAPNNWTTDSSQPIRIYATRTALLGSSALRVAPSGARAAH